jgi:CRP/FNR family cyclic AMP-dependent transcriptional regulator
MVSPELLRRYPFFAGLTLAQITELAKLSEELEVEPGHYFFHEGKTLSSFYLVLEGQVALTISLLDHGERTPIAETATKRREVTVSTVGAGEIFAWSALVPPNHATSNGKALTRCRVVAFDAPPLQTAFESDPDFGYRMILRITQIARDRLQGLYHESLAGGGASG